MFRIATKKATTHLVGGGTQRMMARCHPPIGAAATTTFTSPTASRAFATAPGSDPLDVIRKECIARKLCDEDGYRRPGVHWIFSVAISPEDPSKVCVFTCIHAVRCSLENMKTSNGAQANFWQSNLTLLSPSPLQITCVYFYHRRSHLIWEPSEFNEFRARESTL